MSHAASSTGSITGGTPNSPRVSSSREPLTTQQETDLTEIAAAIVSAASSDISEPIAFDRDIQKIENGTPEAMIVILNHELKKLGSLKSLTEEILSTPPNTKVATIIEIKKIIDEELPTLISGKIGIQYDSKEKIVSFITSIDSRIAQITEILAKPEIPEEILSRYKNEIQRREAEIARLQIQTDSEITTLKVIPDTDKSSILQMDQSIGETLVMKAMLERIITQHFEENQDYIKFAKTTYGCQLEQLQLLNVSKTDSQNTSLNAITQTAQNSISTLPQTVSLDRVTPDRITLFMRENYVASRQTVNTDNLKIRCEATLDVNSLISKVLNGEERVIDTLSHYKALSFELVKRPVDANSHTLNLRLHQKIHKRIDFTIGSQNSKELMAKFSLDLEKQRLKPLEKNHKKFNFYCMNRIAEAKNITSAIWAVLNKGGVPPDSDIINRYRTHLIAPYTEIATLQNRIVEARNHDQFDHEAALKKGFCMRVLAQEIDKGNFLIF